MAAGFKRRTATVNLSTLLKFTNAISALVPECIVSVRPEGLDTRAVDFANVGMIVVNAKVGEGSSLEADLGLDITAMKNILKAISGSLPGDTPLVLQGRESGDPYRPYLEIEVKGELSQHIRIKTLDKRTIRKKPNPPIIAHSVRVDVQGNHLLNAVVACSFQSDQVRIVVDREGTCTIAAKGDNFQHKIEIARGGAGTAAAIYSIDYLKDILKILSESTCILRFQNDWPMEISANLNKEVRIRYLLAPKIEEEKGEDWI